MAPGLAAQFAGGQIKQLDGGRAQQETADEELGLVVAHGLGQPFAREKAR